jgi:hypothetical protein
MKTNRILLESKDREFLLQLREGFRQFGIPATVQRANRKFNLPNSWGIYVHRNDYITCMRLNDGTLRSCLIPYAEIDAGIRHLIRDLNNVGLGTIYCCEGHDGPTDYAYIYFASALPPRLQREANEMGLVVDVNGHILKSRNKVSFQALVRKLLL